jgi:ribosome-binding factor A
MSVRKERVSELLRHLAAEYLLKESDRTSLITVTNVAMSKDLSAATILVSIFPTDDEERAISFMKRKRPDFRDYVKKHSELKVVPFLDFEIDKGEKNRQKIDELA